MKRFIFINLFSLLVIANSSLCQPNSGFIEVDNCKLYYETAGEGKETIVFIHDGLVHSAVWDDQFEVFSKNFRVVRYDRRGYGRSPKPDKNYSNVEDLNAVFDSLQIDKAALIGMSAGGGLTIDFTLKYPDKVSAIVVVGGVVSGFTYSDHMYSRGGRLTTADYSNTEKLMEYIIKEDPYEIAPQNSDAREKLWALMIEYPQNMDITKNRLALPPDPPAIDRLNVIQAPALVVIGEFDIPDVFVHAGAIESGIKGAKRVIINDAGHLVPFEQPEMFNKQVMVFLNSTGFMQLLDTNGVFPAAELFYKKRHENKDWLPFAEVELNLLGYEYLMSGQTKEAIELFKMNVEAYPESANVYDSLGEAYMIDGKKEQAIKNYKKSLELNPDNQNAVERLKRLNE